MTEDGRIKYEVHALGADDLFRLVWTRAFAVPHHTDVIAGLRVIVRELCAAFVSIRDRIVRLEETVDALAARG